MILDQDQRHYVIMFATRGLRQRLKSLFLLTLSLAGVLLIWIDHELRWEKFFKTVTRGDYVIYSRDYIHSFQRFGVGEARIKFLKEFQSPCFLEHSAGSVGYVHDHVHVYAYATAEVTKGMNVHPPLLPAAIVPLSGKFLTMYR